VTKKLKGEVAIRLCTTNRINAPEVAEQVLCRRVRRHGSMARPLLADADFVNKAPPAARRDQHLHRLQPACLDHVFQRKIASSWSTRGPPSRRAG